MTTAATQRDKHLVNLVVTCFAASLFCLTAVWKGGQQGWVICGWMGVIKVRASSAFFSSTMSVTTGMYGW